jgi:putative FmdB family regulatory protein
MLDYAFQAAQNEHPSSFSAHYPKPTTNTKPMPLYEYLCRKCGEKFAKVLTVKEHDTKKVHCPKCESAQLEKIIEPFFAKTGRKS